jgi:uroporphyrinogen-III synthase
VRAAGRDAIALPLFAVRSLAWVLPAVGVFDALLVTSANAIRHAGPDLTALRALPVIAVGAASARAARAAGLMVVATGNSDGLAAVTMARQAGFDRLLHLAGRDRIDLPGVTSLPVYASDAIPIGPTDTVRFVDRTVLLHSPRAARHVADLVDRDARERRRIALAALSPAVADAAGTGWRRIDVAPYPDDDCLIAIATAAD